MKKLRKQTNTNGSVSLTMISPIADKIPSFIIQTRSSLREFRNTSNHPSPNGKDKCYNNK